MYPEPRPSAIPTIQNSADEQDMKKSLSHQHKCREPHSRLSPESSSDHSAFLSRTLEGVSFPRRRIMLSGSDFIHYQLIHYESGPIIDESLSVTTGWNKKGGSFGISSSGKLLNFDILLLKIPSKTLPSRALWDERLHNERPWGTAVKSVALEPDCLGWNPSPASLDMTMRESLHFSVPQSPHLPDKNNSSTSA